MPERGGGGLASADYVQDQFIAKAARAAGAVNSGDWFGFGPADKLAVQVEVDAVAGTAPTLNVLVEHSSDGVEWEQLDVFPAMNPPVVGRTTRNIATQFYSHLRVTGTVAGGAGANVNYGVLVTSEIT